MILIRDDAFKLHLRPLKKVGRPWVSLILGETKMNDKTIWLIVKGTAAEILADQAESVLVNPSAKQ